jgi:transcriptional regulator NrdR family protein
MTNLMGQRRRRSCQKERFATILKWSSSFCAIVLSKHTQYTHLSQKLLPYFADRESRRFSDNYFDGYR